MQEDLEDVDLAKSPSSPSEEGNHPSEEGVRNELKEIGWESQLVDNAEVLDRPRSPRKRRLDDEFD